MKALILILVILLAGCAGETECESPYMKFGDSCCLDRDDNKICDSHETVQQTIIEEKEAECVVGEGLNCEDIKVTSDRIEIVIENILDRNINVHSIEFDNVNCQRVFDDNLFRGQREVFVIPCSLNEGNLIKSSFTLEYWEGDKLFSRRGQITAVVE
ncbi:hypothetical protein KY345_06070 [Candidatus Woesearchaeota archaeon]|nr:hypothetical protein [Candidatus Woesearchaeota archaeon]